MSKIKITCVFKWTRTEEVRCSMGVFVSTTRFSVWLACERGKGSDSIYGETADTTVEECVCVRVEGEGDLQAPPPHHSRQLQLSTAFDCLISETYIYILLHSKAS